MNSPKAGPPQSPHLHLVTSATAAPTPDAAAAELDWSIMMARAQTGDRAAYRRLLEAITPYLRACAVRRLGHSDEIEDAVQDILLTVHAVRHSYDPTRPFGPWLVAICDRRLIDRLRRRGRRRSREDESSPTDDIAGVALSSPDEAIDRRALERAMAALSPEQRRAVRLLKLEEQSLREASAVTGLSIAALKVSSHRALKRLRRYFQKTDEA